MCGLRQLAADNTAFTTAMNALRNSGDMGRSQYNFATSTSVRITVIINSTAAASVTPMGNSATGIPQYNLSLNNAPGTSYLDPSTFNTTVAQGEDPASPAVTLAHELAHVAGRSEADAVLNYENPTRQGTGQPDRTTYSGSTVSNTSAWTAFANWWKSLWSDGGGGDQQNQY